jgi:hypothetical protein
MEFEEMQKIWTTSNQETVYAINEKALHNCIVAKRKKILRIANVSEWLLIIVNLFTAGFVTVVSFGNSKANTIMYVMAAWFFITAIYVVLSRVQRLRHLQVFNRTMLQDLKYAVSTANYQVQLSHIMRLNTFPIALLCILGILSNGVSYWVAFSVGLFFVMAYYFSGWEHNYYKIKKRELEILQNKLESE